MVQAATLFVDDQDSQIHYLCPSLSQQVSGTYYNNTWTTVQSETCDKGWFEYTFYGTGIHVAASMASPGASYSVKIDDGSYEPQSGNGSYNSPILSDGKHTLTYATGSVNTFPSFDYLTVTAGASSSLEGQTLAVDDSDKSVIYSGSWSNSPPTSMTFDPSTSLYGDTTYWSSTVGDSLQFQFTGSSISVFGIVTNVSSTGNVTATYTIDGMSKAQSIPQGTLNSLPMVKLFHADLQPGEHTLSLNITDIQAPRAIGIDFFAYNASFNNIASTSSTARVSHALNAGSKVGIAFGVLAAIALLASLFTILWRRNFLRKSKNRKFMLSDDCERHLSDYQIQTLIP
ncbi:hypothetical protein BDZ97DRAFT_1656771 [Flammula alnicola]|nr:hypothetical protein BDZ97DRAFT_1656771 [Flammula alnicola]